MGGGEDCMVGVKCVAGWVKKGRGRGYSGVGGAGSVGGRGKGEEGAEKGVRGGYDLLVRTLSDRLEVAGMSLRLFSRPGSLGG